MSNNEDVLEKIRRLKANRPKGGTFSRHRGVFLSWEDGDTDIRLVGNFLEAHNHYIAPSTRIGLKGICRPDAFDGDDGLPKRISCFDWDITREEYKKVKTCAACKLASVARKMLKSPGLVEEERKAFDTIRAAASFRREYKWNVLHRADPYIIQVLDNGTEKRVMGLKIASFGTEAYKDIEGIFDQCGFDITNPDDGIDIRVTKGNDTNRTVYSVQAVLEGRVLKVTPLTDEERLLQLHDLKFRCFQSCDMEKMVDAMYDNYREMMEVDDAEEADASEVDAAAAAATEEAEAVEAKLTSKKVSVPVKPSVPTKPITSVVPRKPVVRPPVPPPVEQAEEAAPVETQVEEPVVEATEEVAEIQEGSEVVDGGESADISEEGEPAEVEPSPVAPVRVPVKPAVTKAPVVSMPVRVPPKPVAAITKPAVTAPKPAIPVKPGLPVRPLTAPVARPVVAAPVVRKPVSVAATPVASPAIRRPIAPAASAATAASDAQKKRLAMQ